MFSFCKRGKAPAAGLVNVGWLIDPDWDANFIWEAPRKLTRSDAKASHAKSVAVCPAILDHEARLFEVTCPVDIHLRPGRDAKGQPALLALDGDQSTIRLQYINKLAALMPQEEWRHPNRPMFQVGTPYLFVADDPVYITMYPPIYHFPEKPLPGLMLGGRFPIHTWPRPLTWAFECYEPAKDIIINRGDPWFYVGFETEDPSRHTRLVEAEMTKELREYTNGIRNVTAYVNRTFSLFNTAKQRRPATLLKPKVR